MLNTLDPTVVLEELKTILSFDRPGLKEKFVQEARDFMLESGYPVGNDFRPQGSSDHTLLHRIHELSSSGL
jgi:hypothetical protein